ncbi:MAG: penicillin-binding protein 2 [Paracoccaceae bacterium]|jgi:cell division protein FtsI (penicillin-binding protein 3)
MIRRPLRPIARVLKARESGVDPSIIEAEEKAARMRGQRNSERFRAQSRLFLLAFVFLMAFGTVGWKMTVLATTSPVEPVARGRSIQIVSQRANIVDRNGQILATNLATTSLFAHPQDMVDARAAADGLVAIFDDLNSEILFGLFSGERKFVWIKHKLSPEQRQAVHDIGEPGLQFGPREIRLYPNGSLAAHILGGTAFGREGVQSAEVIGTAGVELQFDTFLRDPAEDGSPLELSIDIAVQAAMRRVLAGGMMMMSARGAAAVLMEVDTGQVIAMVSLPDFDPNHRPAPPASGDPADSPLFNRVAQGRYELGSTFKLFTAALAMETGTATLDTMVPTRGPLRWGKYTIRDFHNYGSELSLMDVIVKSSNIGAANLAVEMGPEAQKDFLRDLGFFDPVALEIKEARRSKPLIPSNWSELSTMTISYGHGLAATPLHLAAAYATITNGGLKVTPTLLKDGELPDGDDRVLSEATSANVREMLRQVVVRGTASLGEVTGYQVGGKTGTADKPNPQGGYYEDKVIATFASVFPMGDPKYVLVVSLDEPVETSGDEPRRTAGWTAVPVGAEIIRRIAPLMGMRPEYFDGKATPDALTLTRN